MSDQDRAAPPGSESIAAYSNSLAQDPELLSEFIMESREHLHTIESNLLSIEDGQAAPDAVHAIFRGFHTIKGLAGFLEFDAMQRAAHEVETLLDRAREGRVSLTADAIDVVLAGSDFLRKWLDCVERAAEGPDPAELIKRVQALCTPDEDADGSTMLAALASAVESKGPQAETAPGVLSESPAGARTAESRSVKVDTGKLDHLVDMIGEMVIAQSMIQHDPELTSVNRPRLLRNLSQLARITDEVQKTTMAMRMVPVEHLFDRMRRVVRDLARKTGKEVDLEIAGGDTELDRNLVEELADPLMHMVRNAVDHGIESPDERIAAGKAPAGRIRLSASHGSGNILIEITDDGRGLDRQKIVDKAVRNGLIGADEELMDDQVHNLIFRPGFSTAAAVTDVSGRGVGMDVVRRQVEKLRGRIEIRTHLGQGSSFVLKLPLTLAIVDGLIVSVGKERYIIPLFAVREMLRPEPGAVHSVQDKGEMTTVRGRLLPVIRLHRRFGIAPRSEDPAETLLIVAEAASRVFCLMVDELIGKQEVVIKSLGGMLQNTPGIAGGAILGDGRVGLILDLDRVYEPHVGVQSGHAAA
jgi:two-component system, chemotaxis family, sensor kinase CheA